MLAVTSATLWTITTFVFVVVTLGSLGYALVRPFTHRSHQHRSGLWVHLP
jgi:quinol-cytochrome oxidoreductase complex cytochrome b subunit